MIICDVTCNNSVIHFTPFDATIRRTEAIVEYNAPDGSGERMRFRAIKGALNTIMSISDVGVITNNQGSKLADDYASKGFRTLAVACTSPVRVHADATLTKDDIRRLRSQKPDFLGVIAVHSISTRQRTDDEAHSCDIGLHNSFMIHHVNQVPPLSLKSTTWVSKS
jgi:magnesium-transporting ATPase (P-type)